MDSSNFRSESTGDMLRVRAGPFQMATGLLRNVEKIEFQSNIFGGSCKTSMVLSISGISPSNSLLLELPSQVSHIQANSKPIHYTYTIHAKMNR